MPDRHWKVAERRIAALLGTVRIPNSGFGQPDIICGNVAVQVKTRKTLPAWLTDAVDQSILDAGETMQPVVVLNLVSQGRKARRFLVADLDHVLNGDDDE